MTRRDFIYSATASATLLSRANAAAPTAVALTPAIDTHIHLYDPARPEGVPWPPNNDAVLYRPHLPGLFRSTVAYSNVVGAIVVEASDWVEDNQWILDLAQANDDIVGFVGSLRPGRREFAEQLKRFAANPLFLGLRLKIPDLKYMGQTAFDTDIRRVADAGLSIDVLGGPTVLLAAVQLARLAPTLRIVVDHLPFRDWDGNLPALRSAVHNAAAQNNIFIKVSDVVRRVNGAIVATPDYYEPALTALLELFGPDRLLYGSNWPVSNHVAPYATIHRIVSDYFASQGRAVAEKYFWRNSLSAYRWTRRGATALLDQ